MTSPAITSTRTRLRDLAAPAAPVVAEHEGEDDGHTQQQRQPDPDPTLHSPVSFAPCL